MKTKALSIMMILFAAFSFGQNASDKLFDKYSGLEGVTSVHITSYMFQLFADLEGEEDMKEFQELAAQIDRIKILSCENTDQNPGLALEFYKDISKNIPLDTYQKLMEVREEGQEVNVLIQESNKKISEVLMLVNEASSTVLISVTGDIDLNKLAKLSSAMNIDGFDKLEDLDEYDE